MVPILVFLLQGINGDGVSVGRTIGYLARHQGEDGSWGGVRPAARAPGSPPGRSRRSTGSNSPRRRCT